MKLIKLTKHYYDTEYRTFSTQPCVIDAEFITSIFPINEYRYDATRVCMKDGRYHDVKETIDEILKMVGEADG